MTVNPIAGANKGMTLLVYDQDSLPRVINLQKKNKQLLFSGKVEGPTYAELWVGKNKNADYNSSCLPLFIEDANITVELNSDNLQSSRVSGSRSNSMLRYQLEVCRENDYIECLSRYVSENRSSVLAPYIVEHYLSQNVDYETLSGLYSLLEGAATKTYHYRLLAHRLENMKKLETGSRLPSFTFVDNQGKTVVSDSVISDSCRHVLLVGTSWCRQCSDVMGQLTANHPDLKTVVIDIERQPKGWDSPAIQTLAVDHIPFIMLLSPDGTIQARDIRVWEIDKYCPKAVP